MLASASLGVPSSQPIQEIQSLDPPMQSMIDTLELAVLAFLHPALTLRALMGFASRIKWALRIRATRVSKWVAALRLESRGLKVESRIRVNVVSYVW
jgi:hypothetical protein